MTTTSATSAINATSDQFLQLLVAQLQNQDPLNPVSNSEFTSQLTQLNTVSSLQSLNASFGEQLKLQQLTQGTQLIGKTVSYVPLGASEAVSGTVASLSVANGRFVLNVNNDAVSLDQIQTVNA